MKKLKKTFFLCPKCSGYTRVKEDVFISILLFHTYWWPRSLKKIIVPELSNRICKSCGNDRQLKKVYLEVDVEENGLEKAYYKPDHTKVEITNDKKIKKIREIVIPTKQGLNELFGLQNVTGVKKILGIVLLFILVGLIVTLCVMFFLAFISNTGEGPALPY